MNPCKIIWSYSFTFKREPHEWFLTKYINAKSRHLWVQPISLTKIAAYNYHTLKYEILIKLVLIIRICYNYIRESGYSNLIVWPLHENKTIYIRPAILIAFYFPSICQRARHGHIMRVLSQRYLLIITAKSEECTI